MKIETFVGNKWVEVEGYDFDDFMGQVVEGEVPFRFTDCTEDEIDNFANYCKEESAGLDDCDYYRLDLGLEFIAPYEVCIYDDGTCYLFEDYVAVINRRAEKANIILNNIKKVE